MKKVLLVSSLLFVTLEMQASIPFWRWLSFEKMGYLLKYAIRKRPAVKKEENLPRHSLDRPNGSSLNKERSKLLKQEYQHAGSCIGRIGFLAGIGTYFICFAYKDSADKK